MTDTIKHKAVVTKKLTQRVFKIIPVFLSSRDWQKCHKNRRHIAQAKTCTQTFLSFNMRIHINICYECIFIFYQWHGQSGKEARTHHNNGAGKVTQQQRGADRPAGTSGGGGRRGYKNGDRVLHLIPSRRKLTQAAAALRGTAVGQCCFCRRTARLPKPDTHFFRWEPWLPNGDTVPLMVSDATIVPVIGMQNSGIFYSDTANFCLWHNSNKLEE